MTRLQLIVTICFSSVWLSACNQNQVSTNTAGDKDSVTTASVADQKQVTFKDARIDTAFESYITLKNALVASDVSLAQNAASVLSEALDQIKGCQNTADIARRISGSTALDQQRKEFTTLSDDFIALIKHADIQEGTTYVQYCPMANSGEGGYWMASTDEIRNPYYGDEMLNCGEVKEELTRK